MYTSIRDIKEDFYKLFHQPIPIPILGKNATKNVPAHFQDKSGMDYTEQDDQFYPCIVIKDYTPEISTKWGTAWEKYSANARDTDNDGIVDTATLYTIPQRFRFRFDVSIVAKKYNDFVSMEDWMAKNFQWNRNIILGAKKVPINVNGDLTTVGQPVFLEIAVASLDRPDGIRDTNYEISFETMVYLDTVDEGTIQQVNILLQPRLAAEGTTATLTPSHVEIIVGPGGPAVQLVINEVPSGAVNGSNATFTTAFNFVPESVSITINGLEQDPGVAYNTTGNNTIHFADSPQVGDVILVDYEKII